MDALGADSGMLDQRRLEMVRRQRTQDFFFHKATMGFSLLVLVALLGILVSLFISAGIS